VGCLIPLIYEESLCVAPAALHCYIVKGSRGFSQGPSLITWTGLVAWRPAPIMQHCNRL
jgi:hypothetical protein